MKALKITASAILILIGAISLLIYNITLQPDDIQPAHLTCPTETPLYDEKSPLKIVSYNVQFFAGKDYVFYFDMPNNEGPDLRPSKEAIKTTVQGIADLILNTDADIVLLQEVHDGAKATDGEDQLAELLATPGLEAYPCHSSAFYWQADFVPHPKILGSVGMKLSTISRYKLSTATRHQLALQPMDMVSQQFYLKRAILQNTLPSKQGVDWQVLNTHFDAFAQGSDTMQQQVSYTQSLLTALDELKLPWVIGGDFNLLAPGAYQDLAQDQQYLYQPKSELSKLLDSYPSIPSLADTSGSEKARWYTHFPNDFHVKGPDRTIDYLFYSQQLSAVEASVNQSEPALRLSDHLPVVGSFMKAKYLKKEGSQ